MSNEIVEAKESTAISSYLNVESVKQSICNALGNEKEVSKFITSIVSAVSLNPKLGECDRGTLMTAALQGAALKLNPSPQLGQFYMIPYDGRVSFVAGWKGIVQLAMRSGSYKKIVVVAIKKGELKSWNPLTEEIDVEIIEDDEKRDAAETVGYYGMFEYTNGFQKCMYWSKEKMERHAFRYSQAYKTDKSRGWSNSFWSKGFDDMGIKTVLRQLLGKWGMMSIEMEMAFETDMAVITPEGKAIYVDNEPEQQVDAAPKEKKETKAAKSIKEQIVLEEVDDI